MILLILIHHFLKDLMGSVEKLIGLDDVVYHGTVLQMLEVDYKKSAANNKFFLF